MRAVSLRPMVCSFVLTSFLSCLSTVAFSAALEADPNSLLNTPIQVYSPDAQGNLKVSTLNTQAQMASLLPAQPILRASSYPPNATLLQSVTKGYLIHMVLPTALTNHYQVSTRILNGLHYNNAMADRQNQTFGMHRLSWCPLSASFWDGYASKKLFSPWGHGGFLGLGDKNKEALSNPLASPTVETPAFNPLGGVAQEDLKQPDVYKMFPDVMIQARMSELAPPEKATTILGTPSLDAAKMSMGKEIGYSAIFSGLNLAGNIAQSTGVAVLHHAKNSGRRALVANRELLNFPGIFTPVRDGALPVELGVTEYVNKVLVVDTQNRAGEKPLLDVLLKPKEGETAEKYPTILLRYALNVDNVNEVPKQIFRSQPCFDVKNQ